MGRARHLARAVSWTEGEFTAVFVFQAEDGIRALVRSRGLGDVYKRQVIGLPPPGKRARGADDLQAAVVVFQLKSARGCRPVSYTHLTLPTSDLV